MIKKLFVLLVLADWIAAGVAIARAEARIAKLEADRAKPAHVSMSGKAIVHELARYKREQGWPGPVSI